MAFQQNESVTNLKKAVKIRVYLVDCKGDFFQFLIETLSCIMFDRYGNGDVRK